MEPINESIGKEMNETKYLKVYSKETKEKEAITKNSWGEPLAQIYINLDSFS